MKRCCLDEWEVNSGAIELRGRGNDGLAERNIQENKLYRIRNELGELFKGRRDASFYDIYILEMKARMKMKQDFGARTRNMVT
jgi:hypothetical protein